MKYLIPLLVLPFVIATAQVADSVAAPLPVAVLTFDGRGISPQEAEILTERLRSTLVQDGRYQVVERSRMDLILQEQGFQQTGCASDECLVQAGRILGVRRMVGGTVGRIGATYTLDVRLFEVESTRILRAVTRTYTGPIDDLLAIIEEIAVELAGGKPPALSAPAGPNVVEQGMDALSKALATVGDAIDTTARNVARMLTPKPKDPDIKRGREQGRLDAQDYHRRFMWLVPTCAAAAGMTYGYRNESVEDQIVAGALAGLVTKIVTRLVAGEPRLPEHLVQKISTESTVYQENYRRAWVSEVKDIRSNGANAGCLLGVAVGYAILHYDDEDLPWRRGKTGN